MMVKKTFMQRWKIASPKQRKVMRLERFAPDWAKKIR